MNTPCSTDPDKWFTVLLPGAASPKRNKKLVNDVKEAINTCFECPVMIKCGELGMLEKNLYWGIWGGMLPAERMLRRGKNKEDYPVGTFKYAEYKMYEMVYNAVV